MEKMELELVEMIEQAEILVQILSAIKWLKYDNNYARENAITDLWRVVEVLANFEKHAYVRVN